MKEFVKPGVATGDDVQKIFAEAKNETLPTPDAEVYEAINKIRRRANGLDINTPNISVDLAGLSKDGFRNAVLSERAWEFAFEWKRWHDLVRTERVQEANANHPFIDPSKITKNNYL
ncbi:MAG: hypothetical protein CVU05_09405, partial [Bacteroidetes bacterium HGW-Bacteroidetes-21]